MVEAVYRSADPSRLESCFLAKEAKENEISRYIKVKLVKLLRDLLEMTSLINGYS